MNSGRAEADLRVGRLRLALSLAIAALAAVAVALSNLPWPLRVFGAACLLGLGLSARRRERPGRLVFHPDRTLGVDGWRGRPQARFVSTLLVVLRCDDAVPRHRAIFRDEIDESSWRRLRAWLRHP